MAWIVVVFAIVPDPLGAVSIVLLIIQPILYGTVCTLCLATAVLSPMRRDAVAVEQRSQLTQDWPEESREAAQMVIEAHGEPDEATDTQLVWHKAGPWKRIVATSSFFKHDFPAPHIDSVESFLDYRVPVDKFTPLAGFDGSVVCERTAGEV